MPQTERRDVDIPFAEGALRGTLAVPPAASGIVTFAHGSGSGRHSPRNQYVARVLNDAGLATLLIDLLTANEERVDSVTAHLRFDIDFLAERLRVAAEWARSAPETSGLSLGLFGASTGAAAALQFAGRSPNEVDAVVSRGGRPDLAMEWLPRVTAPTLLIVGGEDHPVIAMNRQAYEALSAEREMVIIPGATHLFQERGALEEVAKLASDWFVRHLSAATRAERRSH